MAENLEKRPSKGILKNSSSFDKPESSNRPRRESSKGTKFDEMNIIATLHPPDKDYGHMKIDEPKTPYNYVDDSLGEHDELDATDLAKKIQTGANAPPKFLQNESDDDDEDDDLTPEEKARRKEFLAKRKKHYNEYYAVKLARKKLEEESDEDDDVNDVNEINNDEDNSMDVEKSSRSTTPSPSSPASNTTTTTTTDTQQTDNKRKLFCPVLRAKSKSPQP